MKITITVSERVEDKLVPVANAKVALLVDGYDLATLLTGLAGKATHTEKRQTIGKILSCIVEANGFERGGSEVELNQLNDQEVDVILKRTRKQVTISGVVTDGERLPIADAGIELGVSGEQVPVLTDSKGQFVVVLKNVTADQSISWLAHREGYERQEGQLEIGEEKNTLNITLVPIKIKESEKPRIELAISTVDEGEKPLKGVMVAIELEGKELERQKTDPKGKVTFSLTPDLADKTITYVAEIDGYQLARGQCG